MTVNATERTLEEPIAPGGCGMRQCWDSGSSNTSQVTEWGAVPLQPQLYVALEQPFNLRVQIYGRKRGTSCATLKATPAAMSAP